MGLGRVEDACTKCLHPLRHACDQGMHACDQGMHACDQGMHACEKYLEMGKMCSGRLWIRKRPMIRSVGMVCGRC